MDMMCRWRTIKLISKLILFNTKKKLRTISDWKTFVSSTLKWVVGNNKRDLTPYLDKMKTTFTEGKPPHTEVFFSRNIYSEVGIQKQTSNRLGVMHVTIAAAQWYERDVWQWKPYNGLKHTCHITDDGLV